VWERGGAKTPIGAGGEKAVGGDWKMCGNYAEKCETMRNLWGNYVVICKGKKTKKENSFAFHLESMNGKKLVFHNTFKVSLS